MAYWGFSTLLGREPPRPLVNAIGIVLMTLSAAALAAGVLEAGAYRHGGLHGPGGRAGTELASLVASAGGTLATVLLFGLGIASGFVLSTDRAVPVLARNAVEAGRRTAGRIGDLAPRIAGFAGRSTRRARNLVTLFTGGEPRPPGVVRIPILEQSRARRTKENDREENQERAAEPSRSEAVLETRVAVEEPQEPPAPASRRPSRPKQSARSGTARKRAAPSASRPTGSGDGYELPSLDLLDTPKRRDPRAQETMIRENADILDETLRDFRVEAEVVAHRRGPVVTLFELDLAAGVKVNRIHNLAEDLAVALKAPAVRVVSPLPGKSTIGVEVPNPVRDDVRLRALMESEAFERNQDAIPIFMGSDVAGNPLIEDLTTMPHLLIAGATGSGKSVCINAILTSILMTRTPEEVRLILIDPKQVELAFFDRVPHLMSPVVRKMEKALKILEWLVDRMEQRYALFHAVEVRNILGYNELGRRRLRARIKELGIGEEEAEEGIGFPDRLPYIVLVVDELAELMMMAGKEIENQVIRLAQKSRAVGIHIVLATQRPSTDVITGLIKANMPCRASFQVASKIDSRVVLDRNGAETLLGRGDMLYLPPRTSHLVRSQGTFVSDGEVRKVVGFLANRMEQDFDESLEKAQSGEQLRDEDKDPRYDEAVRVILDERRGSASLLQRALGIGYTRGSRILEQMHKEGIVGPYKGSKAREVLLTLDEWEQQSGAGSETH
jgi:S-DNA-T family DNA segregation ATPase FtsK/SpoIIIE